jgi:hypothetical protein
MNQEALLLEKQVVVVISGFLHDSLFGRENGDIMSLQSDG